MNIDTEGGILKKVEMRRNVNMERYCESRDTVDRETERHRKVKREALDIRNINEDL